MTQKTSSLADGILCAAQIEVMYSLAEAMLLTVRLHPDPLLPPNLTKSLSLGFFFPLQQGECKK